MRRYWPILFLAVLPLVPLWRAVFAGEAIGAFEEIRQMAPWNGPTPSKPWDVLQADSVLQFYPWRDLVFGAWSRGEAPFWNPYELAGTPLLANSQSGGFYPPHVLMGLLHLPTQVGMTMLAWAHLFLAGLGVYGLCRRLGASEAGAAIAGGSFSLSAFMIAWTALPSVISTCAWIPWTLWAVYGLRERPWRSGIWLSILTASMLLAGHLQFAAYGCLAITVVAISLLSWRALVLAVAAMCVGGMLAAPQVLPVLEYSKFSHRRGSPTAEGYEAYLATSLKPFELLGVTYPKLMGDPSRFAPESRLSSYWPQYVKRGANFAEGALAIGPVLLMLLFGLRKRAVAEAAGVGVVGTLALLIALGTVLNYPLYWWLPGWSSTGSPGRAIILFVLAACVLASKGLVEAEGRRALLPAGALAGLSILQLVLIVWAAPLLGGDNPALPSLISGSILGPMQWALAACGITVVAYLVWWKKRSPIGLLLAVPVSYLFLCGGLLRTGVPLEQVTGPGDGKRIAALNEKWGILESAHALLPPNTASLSRICELGGYDSLLHRETKALLDEINGEDSAPPANGNMLFIKAIKPSDLAEAGVTEVWDQEDGAVRRVPIEGPGRASTPNGPGRIVEQGFSHTIVDASGPGKLTLRDRRMPGWTARIDGREANLSGDRWLEVELPPGTHRVIFTYRPPGLVTGLLLFMAAVVVLVSVWLLKGRDFAKPGTYNRATEGGIG
jgi:hypothetical protein